MAQVRRGALSFCASMVGDWNITNEAGFRHQMTDGVLQFFFFSLNNCYHILHKVQHLRNSITQWCQSLLNPTCLSREASFVHSEILETKEKEFAKNWVLVSFTSFALSHKHLSQLGRINIESAEDILNQPGYNSKITGSIVHYYIFIKIDFYEVCELQACRWL